MHVTGRFHSAQRMPILNHLASYRPETSVVVVTMLYDEPFPRFDREEMRGLADSVIETGPSLPPSYSPESREEDGKGVR